MLTDLAKLLQKSSSDHSHLCPRQVLGVRMGMAGLEALGAEAPINAKTMLIIIETGGCFADGIRVATGATVGHRTLRVEDVGKIAATFTRLKDGKSLRLAPRPDIRMRALEYASDEKRHYFAQLKGYQLMPVQELFSIRQVELITPAQQIISHQKARALCAQCGEEIINEREVVVNGKVLCQTCAYGGYYRVR